MKNTVLATLSGALLLVALALLALGVGHLASASQAVNLRATAAVVATGRARGAQTAAPVPTFDPDTLDLVLVHEAVTAQVNQARAERGLEPLIWDEALQEAAEGRARAIVRGEVAWGGEIDDALAEQLGEPAIVPEAERSGAAELRACLSANVTAPEDVARYAVGGWLDEPKFAMMLLGSWERIGVGFDWPCPQEDAGGLVLVVVLAGGKGLKEG